MNSKLNAHDPFIKAFGFPFEVLQAQKLLLIIS